MNTKTFSAGRTCDEMIALWVLNKAMNSQAFEIYIETQLAPNLQPYDNVIADNLSVHKNQRTAQILKKAQIKTQIKTQMLVLIFTSL